MEQLLTVAIVEEQAIAGQAQCSFWRMSPAARRLTIAVDLHARAMAVRAGGWLRGAGCVRVFP